MNTMAVKPFYFLVIWVAAFGLHGSFAATFDVTKYAAIGDGKHDDTRAFNRAWAAACANGGTLSTLLVPQGKTFLLSPMKFQGPCKSVSTNVKILGTLVAPPRNAWKGCDANSWLSFRSIDGLVVDGSGTIDGKGAQWWGKADPDGFPPNGESSSGCDRPSSLHFSKCQGLRLSGFHLVDSPKGHMIIYECNGASVSDLHILAPEDSPNTDGIDLYFSKHVTISNSIIQTGDDCVTINNGTSNVEVSEISCGPGHGISVGSLGQDGSYAAVEEITVKNCKFFGSQNGVRIKTWPGGHGYARQIRFEEISLTNVKNPVIIDQLYCNGEFKCGDDKPSAVQVSDVTFKGVTGSTDGEIAIQLVCSESKACTNIVMEDVNITPAVPGAKITTVCKNVQGQGSSTSPSVSCLTEIQ